jgi:hypothetical protein
MMQARSEEYSLSLDLQIYPGCVPSVAPPSFKVDATNPQSQNPPQKILDLTSQLHTKQQQTTPTSS